MRSAEEDEPVEGERIDSVQNPSNPSGGVTQTPDANGEGTDPMARYRVPHPGEGQARQIPKQALQYADPAMSDVWNKTPAKPSGSTR